MDKQAVIAIRDEILEAALPNVPFDGWSWEAIGQAAEECGYDQAMAVAVFPARMTDVLDAFSDRADRQMLDALSDTNPEDLKVRERIAECVIRRFEMLAKDKEAVRKSLLFWALPTRKPRAAKIIWRTADRIWDWAGDTATDYNRYTKRGLLSGIIVSTTLAWLDDTDPDMQPTKAFLSRRIENVMTIGKLTGKLKSVSPFKKSA